MDRLAVEESVRSLFNRMEVTRADKTRLRVGDSGATHEYDLYETGKIIGGITTSPWKNSTGTNNSGGQDRASTELLWLTLWSGAERRVMVFTDLSMANNITKRWGGCPFPHRIDILHCELAQNQIHVIGTLGTRESAR